MAWYCVPLIKNDNTGEYQFTVFPVGNYSGPVDTSDTTISYGGYRESGSESGSSANFKEALGIIANIESQGTDRVGKFSSSESDYNTFNRYIYGKSGGTAMRLNVTVAADEAHSYTAEVNKYTSFNNSVQVGRISSSFAANSSNSTKNFVAFGLLINDEAKKIWACIIRCSQSWYTQVGVPAYYDRTDVSIFVFDNHDTNNFWDIFSDSIPSSGPGGGGPYDDGGTSTSGDQDPSWDDSSDVIGIPPVPSFSLILNKLIHAWAPSVSNLDDIGTYLWSNFDLTDPTKTLSRIFQSPMDYILTLHALPFAVSAGSAIELTLAGFATGVMLPPLTAQFKDISCGSVTIKPYWDNYLDYNPYTKITLCLPFAGQVTLDPDEVMGKSVSVMYRVDCLTGSFVCFVYIAGDKVLGQYAGNCALSIPISAADYGRFNAAILGVAGSAASAFGAVASGGSAIGAAGNAIGSAVQEIQDAKVRVAHSGGLTGTPGFMGIQKPYLIIHRARQSIPAGYGGFHGYPLNVTKTLGDCSGFTSVKDIHLEGIPLTEPELEELQGILQGGIII